jgi:outer membrane protein
MNSNGAIDGRGRRVRGCCDAVLLGLLLMFGNSCTAMTLPEAYEAAFANDAQYSASRNEWLATQEKLPQARASLLPNVTLTANTDWNRARATQPYPIRDEYNSNAYQLRLTQPVFRPQSLTAVDQSHLQILRADAVLAQAGADLMLRVAQAWYDLLLAHESLAYVLAQKEAIGQQLQHMQQGLKLGVASIVDVKEAQARFDLVASQEIQANGDLDVKRFALFQLVGRDLGELPARSADAQRWPPAERGLAQWLVAARQDNFNVLAAKATLEFAERDVQRTKQALAPTVDLVVARNVNKADSPLGPGYVRSETYTSSAGLQLNLPLFEGGGSLSRIREAEAIRAKARDELEAAQRAAALSARQAYVGTQSGRAQVKALEIALDSNESALTATRRGFQAGTRSNIDVLNAEQQTYSTRRDLAKARYDAEIAQLKLELVAGAVTLPAADR